jgi:uncharacterized RDD family membrane protein YckC
MANDDPFRAPASDVRDQLSEGQLAGRGKRLGAAIIDTLILLAVVVPMMWVGGYFSAAMEAASRGQQVGFGTVMLWAVIGFIVFVVIQGVPLNASGQTWGKKLLNIRIVDLDGNKPPFAKLIGLRYLPIQIVANVPMVGPLLGLVNVLLIFRGDRRCGHDLIAGTRVVDCA